MYPVAAARGQAAAKAAGSTAAGPASPTSTTSGSPGDVAWTNPNNSQASDNSRATATLAAPQTTEVLSCTGFDFSSIPDGSAIDGILVEVERGKTLTGQCCDLTVQLIVGGSQAGDNKATATNWPLQASEAYASYGGAAVLWGLTPTAAQVKGSDFGVAVAAQYVSGVSVSAAIDHVRITVYYH